MFSYFSSGVHATQEDVVHKTTPWRQLQWLLRVDGVVEGAQTPTFRCIGCRRQDLVRRNDHLWRRRSSSRSHRRHLLRPSSTLTAICNAQIHSQHVTYYVKSWDIASDQSDRWMERQTDSFLIAMKSPAIYGTVSLWGFVFFCFIVCTNYTGSLRIAVIGLRFAKVRYLIYVWTFI